MKKYFYLIAAMIPLFVIGLFTKNSVAFADTPHYDPCGVSCAGTNCTTGTTSNSGESTDGDDGDGDDGGDW